MEKYINTRIEEYMTSFKTRVTERIKELSIGEKKTRNDLLEYIYEYENLSFTKEELALRKRVKNSIPDNNRCNAKRANGEQCTRRRKDDCQLCGTHMKGSPYGIIVSQSHTEPLMRVEVIAHEIDGIVQYVDSFGNAYKTEDVLQEKENPAVVQRNITLDSLHV